MPEQEIQLGHTDMKGAELQQFIRSRMIRLNLNAEDWDVHHSSETNRVWVTLKDVDDIPVQES